MAALDLTGKRFGRLVAQQREGARNRKALWRCSCDCGGTALVIANYLQVGTTRSCGCLRVETNQLRLTTHRLTGTPEYRSWNSLRNRCLNESNAAYHKYGGRGITICARWLESFANFLEDMGPRPGPQHSIERKDNNLGYSKENCVWATAKVQGRNTRRNYYLMYEGRRVCLAEAAEMAGVPYTLLYYRVVTREWPIEKAIALLKRGPNE